MIAEATRAESSGRRLAFRRFHATRFCPRRTTSGLALVTLLLLAPARGADAAPAGDGLAFDYHIYAGGLYALSLTTRLALDPQAYRIDLDAKVDGLPAVFFTYNLTARVEGRRDSDGLRPARYRSANRWRANRERWVEVEYGPEGPLETRADPPLGKDDRKLVPVELRRNTLDPISGVFALLEGVEDDGRCASEIAVFDGRRRYDLIARQIGPAQLQPSAIGVYSGPAIECRIAVKQVTGFWDKPRMKNRFPEEIVTFLATVLEGVPPVPVRLELQNVFGAVVIHLVSYSANGARTAKVAP
ncbi:MAG: DUF3108 domain-containing protein [Kiloniellales bacterium]